MCRVPSGFFQVCRRISGVSHAGDEARRSRSQDEQVLQAPGSQPTGAGAGQAHGEPARRRPGLTAAAGPLRPVTSPACRVPARTASPARVRPGTVPPARHRPGTARRLRLAGLRPWRLRRARLRPGWVWPARLRTEWPAWLSARWSARLPAEWSAWLCAERPAWLSAEWPARLPAQWPARLCRGRTRRGLGRLERPGRLRSRAGQALAGTASTVTARVTAACPWWRHRAVLAGVSVVAAGTLAFAGLGVADAFGSSTLTTAQIASKIDPGLVDINTTLGYQQEQAAGTGIVLSSNGEILTNNHVIDGATASASPTSATARPTRPAWSGYDRTKDIAVLQLQGASGLQTATLGNSSQASRSVKASWRGQRRRHRRHAQPRRAGRSRRSTSRSPPATRATATASS